MDRRLPIGLKKKVEIFEDFNMESSINDNSLSEYMAFVVDPAIFEKNNLIRLGYDAETIICISSDVI